MSYRNDQSKKSSTAFDQASTLVAVVELSRDSWLIAAVGRVEDGRGNLGHAASPRFPPPLIELYVPISGIQLSDWFHRKAHDAVDKGKRSRRSRRCSP
jgi:hypothetical protein